jgi:hypothetical protein
MSGSVLVQYSEECEQFSTVQTTFIQIHKMYKHQGLNFCLKQYSMSINNRPIFYISTKIAVENSNFGYNQHQALCMKKSSSEQELYTTCLIL